MSTRPHDPVQSTAALQRAVELYRALGNELGIGYALARLAGAFARMDRFHDAERALDEAVPLLERCQLSKALARCFDESGDLKMLTGDPTGARIYYEKALALYRQAGAERYVLIMLGGLAQTTWELGDLDAAVDRYQEVFTLMCKAPIKNVFSLGWVLGALAALYTERAELEKAQVAMRDCRLFLDKAGGAWIVSDHDALLTGLMGKITNAARVAGYVDSAFAAKNGSRSRAEVRARDKLQSVLCEKLAPDQLMSLLAEGATMTRDQAIQLIADN